MSKNPPKLKVLGIWSDKEIMNAMLRIEKKLNLLCSSSTNTYKNFNHLQGLRRTLNDAFEQTQQNVRHLCR